MVWHLVIDSIVSNEATNIRALVTYETLGWVFCFSLGLFCLFETCSLGYPQTYCLTQAVLELTIHLSQPSMCWAYWHARLFED